MVADSVLYVSDNSSGPVPQSSPIIGKPESGDPYAPLAEYNYGNDVLWDIEFETDGKTARGFILK